ncbi:MAG: DUF302 domain-containing protein [Gemmatimonadales bacterium]|jgi:uncharacterized protein (DUF302 family)
MTTAALAFEAKLTVPYAQAIDMVTAALKDEGFGVLTRIDVHSTLKEKIGVEFRPYSILGACNPTLAHRAMSHYAEAGLLLPCNVTVEADGSGSVVRIADPDVMLSVGGMDQDPALRSVATEARVRLSRVAEVLRANPAAA